MWCKKWMHFKVGVTALTQFMFYNSNNILHHSSAAASSSNYYISNSYVLRLASGQESHIASGVFLSFFLSFYISDNIMYPHHMGLISVVLILFHLQKNTN